MDRVIAEQLAEMEAEDDAHRFLATLPAHSEIVTALRALAVLQERWRAEADEMRRLNDPRPVYQITPEDWRWLAVAIAKYQSNPLWATCPYQHVIDLLTVLPLDAAWWTAYRVARPVLVLRRQGSIL